MAEYTKYKQILVVDSNSRASAKELSADNIKNAIEAVKNNESLDEKDNQNCGLLTKMQIISNKFSGLLIIFYFNSTCIYSEELNSKIHEVFPLKNCAVMTGQQNLWFTIGCCIKEIYKLFIISNEKGFIENFVYEDLNKRKSKYFETKFISFIKVKSHDFNKEFKIDPEILKKSSNGKKSILKNQQKNNSNQFKNNVRFSENVVDNEKNSNTNDFDYKSKIKSALNNTTINGSNKSKEKEVKLDQNKINNKGYNSTFKFINSRDMPQSQGYMQNGYPSRGFPSKVHASRSSKFKFFNSTGCHQKHFPNNNFMNSFQYDPFGFYDTCYEDDLYGFKNSYSHKDEFMRMFDSHFINRNRASKDTANNNSYLNPKVIELNSKTAKPIFNEDPFSNDKIHRLFTPHLVKILEIIKEKFDGFDGIEVLEVKRLVRELLNPYRNSKIYKSPLATDETINKYLEHIEDKLFASKIFTVQEKKLETTPETVCVKITILEIEIERLKEIADSEEQAADLLIEQEIGDDEKLIIIELLFNFINALLISECSNKFKNMDSKEKLKDKIISLYNKELAQNNFTDKEKETIQKYPDFYSIVFYILENEGFVKLNNDGKLKVFDENYPKIYGSIQTATEQAKGRFFVYFKKFLRINKECSEN